VIATIEPATPEALTEIEQWCYEPPYDFYDGGLEPNGEFVDMEERR
jgi:hypothetical protein